MLELAGQDGTEAFEEIGHSQDARDLLEKLLVGTLDAKSVPKVAKATPAPVIVPKDSGTNWLVYVIPVAIAIWYYYQNYV